MDEKNGIGEIPHYHRSTATPQERGKKVAEVTAKEVQDETASVHWTPGVLVRFPWLGFAAMITMLVAIAMSVVILKTSDGEVREDWPTRYDVEWKFIKDSWREKARGTNIKPSVALAICNTITNVALGIAIAQGITISWWRRALHGSTVAQLHSSWAYSTSIKDLLFAGRKFNLIALAALTAKIALIDNLLLQQAAKTVPATYQPKVVGLKFPMVDHLPVNYAGQYDSNFTIGYVSRGFSNDLYQYSTDSDQIPFSKMGLTGEETGCEGWCFGQVPGFGFHITCTDETDAAAGADEPESKGGFDFNPQSIAAHTASADNPDPDAGPTVLSTLIQSVPANTAFEMMNFTKITFPRTVLMLTTVFSKTETKQEGGTPTNCSLVQKFQHCWLEPGGVQYATELSFSKNPQAGSQSDRMGARLSNYYTTIPETTIINRQFASSGTTVPDNAWTVTDDSYAGFIRTTSRVFGSLFGMDVSLQYTNATGFTARPTDSVSGDGSAQLSPARNWWFGVATRRTDPQSCVMNIQNPMGWMLMQINTIMFRSSVSAACDGFPDEGWDSVKVRNFATMLEPQQVLDTIGYKSDYRFLGAAVGVMLFCLFCTLPNYWGFWELGRKVTFSPMEVASAFQAPVLQHPIVAGGGEVDKLLKEVGKKRIVYGEVEAGRLGVADEENVHKLEYRGKMS